MFIPPAFELTDRAAAGEVLQDYDFGLLVTCDPEGLPVATHVPLLFLEQGEKGIVWGHLARANTQWRHLESLADAKAEALTIFQGPHAYVSPQWYGGDGPRVPTWVYVAVHLYGIPRIIDDPEEVHALLQALTEKQESHRSNPWLLESQSDDYLAKMRRGIVAFELEVTRFEAKAKMNQNKPRDVAEPAARAMLEESDPMAKESARWMSRLCGYGFEDE